MVNFPDFRQKYSKNPRGDNKRKRKTSYESRPSPLLVREGGRRYGPAAGAAAVGAGTLRMLSFDFARTEAVAAAAGRAQQGSGEGHQVEQSGHAPSVLAQ